MAKPKVDYIVKVSIAIPEMIQVWCGNLSQAAMEIGQIEGITSVSILFNERIEAMTDPRYDVNEIAQEIRDLLGAEVPQLFKKSFED